MLLESLALLVGLLHVFLHRSSLGLHRVDKFVLDTGGAAGYQGLGDRQLDILHHLVQNPLAKSALGGLFAALHDASPDVLAQLLDRVELAALGGEIVIGRGKHPLLDLLDGYVKLGLLAGELFRLVGVRETKL